MKKFLALVLAATMMVSIMSAFAASTDGDLTADATITITGLEKGDTVNLYQVVEWIDGEGWQMKAPFRTVTAGDPPSVTYATGCQAIENSLNSATTMYQVTAADVATLAAVVQGNTANLATPATTLGDGATSFTYSIDTQDKAGMYIALIAPGAPDTVYNPIIVSTDFSRDNETNEIDSSEVLSGTSIVKKKPVEVLKTEPKATNDVGDTFHFTVTTTIPAYAASFKNTFFTISDTLSQYLDLDANSIAVKDTDSNAEVDVSGYTTTSTNSFVIKFPHSYVSALTSPKNITITYDAKLNVPVSELTNVVEKENEIYVSFPNNPNDSTGKEVSVSKDATREYTFSIDSNILGNSEWKTGELVKVGLNADGSIAESYRELDNGSEHAALKGATFGVYTSEEAARSETTSPATYSADGQQKLTEGLYTNTTFNGTVVSDADGLLTITGLDEGTYYIKELDAPNGYIRDKTVHSFKITPVWDENVEVTEYYTVDADGNVTWYDENATGRTPYTYIIPKVLKSYKVTVDGTSDSNYTWNNDKPTVSGINPGDSSTEIINRKGTELPSTGGIGTTLFYTIGGLMVLAAGIVLVSRRKAEEE